MKKLGYQINPKQSKKLNCLIIDLILLKTISGRNQISSQLPRLTSQELQSYMTPANKPLLQLLIQEENRFRRKDPKPSQGYSQFRIHYSCSLDTLKLLSKTGSFYHKSSQIICDFLSPAKLIYYADVHENEFCQITAKLEWGSLSVNIHDLDLFILDEQAHLLRGSIIKILPETFHERWLKKVYSKQPYTLNKPSFQDLSETLEQPNLLTEPSLKISDALKEKLQAPEEPLAAFPILKLKDPQGFSADLWIHFEKEKPQAFHELSLKKQESVQIWEEDLIESGYYKKKLAQSHYYCPMDKVSESLSFLLDIGWTIYDMHQKQILLMTKNSIQILEKGQKLIAKGSLSYQDCSTNVSSVIKALDQNQKFINLSEHQVGLLDGCLSHHEISLLSQGDLIGAEVHIHKASLGHLQAITSSTQTIDFHDSVKSLYKNIQNFSTIEACPPSKSFSGQLRPYQEEGVNWLSFLQSSSLCGLLADDMGLGKTVQVLAFLSTLPPGKAHLIVVPTTLIFNWKNEIIKFLPTAKTYIHSGPKRNKTLCFVNQSDIVLTSYSLIKADLDLFKKASWKSIILDESQAIKNPKSQTAQSLQELYAPFKLSISGTPIENSLQDLWSQFRFLLPSLLGKKEDFLIQASHNLNVIRERIKPFILRRSKENVLDDLPEKIEQTIFVNMDEQQQTLYDTYLAKAKKGLLEKISLDGLSKHKVQVFETILRLRQICCHPLLIRSILDEKAEVKSAKFHTLFNDLENVISEGAKVIIYSQFVGMLNLIGNEVQKRNWNQLRLDGSTKNREEIVAQFQKDPKISIFLLSLKAGGVGLNLTAADYVFLYDPWWNSAIENQAIDRAHRMGRKNIVIAKRYMTSGTIEEKMMDLKASKKQLATQLISEKDLNSHLSFEDLQFLLS